MPLTRPRFSQFDTSILTFTDPLQQVNFLADKANIDIGWVLNRDGGISSNVAIIWQESAGAFALALTTSSGAPPAANLAITSYANLIISTLTANSITTSGNVTSTYFLGSGQFLTGLPTAYSNVNVKAYTESMGFQNYGNVNVAAYLSFGAASSLNTTGNIISTGAIHNNVIVNTGNINAVGGYFVGNGYFLTGIVSGGGGNNFSNIFINGQNPVLADTTSDTLTIVGGTGIYITTNAAIDSVTFSLDQPGAFGSAGDFGAITNTATVIEDEGSVADGATLTYDLGSIISASGLIYPDQLVLPIYTTASLPNASMTAAQLIYDSTSRNVVYSDGSNWQPVAAQSYAVAMSVALG